MASATVGSARTVTIKGVRYPVAGDSDPSRDLGGYSKERMMNGDGSARVKMTIKPWEIGSITVDLNDTDRSQEALQEVINDPNDVPISIEYVSGISYSGVGSISGDLKKSAQNGTADITLDGGGTLTQD